MGAREFYFAWLADEATAFDPVAHKRKDLHLRSVSLREDETVSAHTFTVVTEAMDVATLAGHWWGVLSFQTADGTLWPLAKGRRRPVPARSAFGEQTLEFSCLPSDWQARQNTVLAPLKVLPYFDPLLVAPDRQDDPNEILDGRRVIGRFDRVTGEYGVVELLGIGLPLKSLGPGQLVGWKDGGGIKRRDTQAPLAGVDCEVVFEWTQALNGTVSCKQALLSGFRAANVGDPGPAGPGGRVAARGNKPSLPGVLPDRVVASLTGENLVNSYPQQGSGVNGASGYSVIISSIKAAVPPDGAPLVTGACRAQKARYDYSTDADLTKPLGTNLEISYYDADLVLGFELRQKRRERFTFYVANAGVDPSEGKVEKITARGQDPTVNTDASPYLQNEHVSAGDIRRVGQRLWQVLIDHVTLPSFQDDLEDSRGRAQWTLLPDNGSAAGGVDAATYLTTRRGAATLVCVGFKAIKKLSLSKRNGGFDFVVPLDQWPDVSTGWAVELTGDPRDVPGGRAIGKVVNVNIEKDAPNDFAKAVVTIACCRGTGGASPSPDQGLNPSGQPWDGISLSQSIGLPFPLTPVPGATVLVENGAGDQVAYIQAHDFTGQPGRNDRQANDPKHLLSQVRTKITLSCNPISGQPALTLDASLYASPYQGWRQLDVPTV